MSPQHPTRSIEKLIIIRTSQTKPNQEVNNQPFKVMLYTLLSAVFERTKARASAIAYNLFSYAAIQHFSTHTEPLTRLVSNFSL